MSASEQNAEFEAWCAGRPPEVAEVARRLPPWHVYWLRTTGQRAVIVAYSEPDPPKYPHVTIRADVWRDDGPPGFDALTSRQVFGLLPDDFTLAPPTPTPLPRTGEP